ncbi:MAG TPA: substrate-binding domain-containing protein [Hyphomicrobiaceae bacterium]|nr:substrate-binding domain-containing protein [Hyphomicrobiaceae bacterium]
MSSGPRQKSVSVMSGLALEVAVNRWIKPKFESETGLETVIDWRPTTALMQSIEEGARADIIIAISASMEKLEKQGVILSGTRTLLADSVLGVGVKQGAARPDVSSVDAFKRAMVTARAVAYSRAGASGIYFAGLIKELGIAEAVNAKAVIIPMGFTAEKVADGEAELAIQQISELMTVAGIDIAGPFPECIQVTSTFEAAVFSDAPHPEGARALMDMLKSPFAHQAYADGGLASRLSIV